MKRNSFQVFSAIVVITMIVACGCGGGGKKKQQVKGEPVGIITGGVDVFSGFGMEPGVSTLAKQLKEEVLVKLYRVQPDGSGLTPVSGVQAGPLGNGAFRLDKVPIGERTLVVRIEKAAGEPILAALVPPVLPGSNFVLISPETDVEVSIFLEVISKGIRRPGDVKPEEVDVSFIKEIVTPQLFFDIPVLEDNAAFVKALVPVVREGYLKYIEGLTAPGGSPDDPSVVTIVDYISGPLERMEIKREKREPVSEKDEKQFSVLLDKAVSEVGLVEEAISPSAVWGVARYKALFRAARCLSRTKDTPGCPEHDPDAPDLSRYGLLLEDSIIANRTASDLKARVETLFPRGVATGSRWLPPVDVVEKLVNLPGGTVEPFRAEVRRLMRDGEDTRDHKSLKIVLGNFRDTLLTGVVGMDSDAAQQLLAAVYRDAQPVMKSLGDPGMSLKQTGQAHKKFLASYDASFQSLRSAVRTRFSKLEDKDSGKLTWALFEIVLNTTLYGISADLFVSRDTDGDTVPDNVERILGTEASDIGSVPAEVLTATPRSMLPPQPPDSDQDGFFDAVEVAVGTNPENAASKPVPGKMKFCDVPSPLCLMPPDEENLVGDEMSVTGKVVFQEQPVSNLIVGLYSEPDFLGRAPDKKAGEISGADGAFAINVSEAGRYFIVAFRDTDGNGSPGSGEAVGYYGEVYPRRAFVDAGSPKVELNFSMKGLLGKAKCEGKEAYDPVSGECVSECPDGFEVDALTGECRCGKGKLYIDPESVCGEECPEGTILDPVRGGCFCPEGTLADRKQKECKCPEGMILDKESSVCLCTQGVLFPLAMTCVDECPETFVEDVDTGSCVCLDGGEYDQAVSRCVCVEGLLDPYKIECVEMCDLGMIPGTAGKECVCPGNETYDGEKGVCVCQPGMERTAQGACANPAVPKRPEKDKRRRDRDDREGLIPGATSTEMIEDLIPGATSTEVVIESSTQPAIVPEAEEPFLEIEPESVATGTIEIDSE